MKQKTYRTAQGRVVDLGAMIAQNETVRAVGNMNVNARGDIIDNQGRVLSRERLIDLVQGQGVAVVDRAIDTHVFGLRKKLGDCADVVETIRGVGYRVRN